MTHHLNVTKDRSSDKKESEEKFQEFNGRVVLGGDIVKNDSGNDATFTEKGPSASHMRVLDVFSRFLGCS